jgi:hypothetical protein
MIDVQNASYVKLSPWDPADAVRAFDGILIAGEQEFAGHVDIRSLGYLIADKVL